MQQALVKVRVRYASYDVVVRRTVLKHMLVNSYKQLFLMHQQPGVKDLAATLWTLVVSCAFPFRQVILNFDRFLKHLLMDGNRSPALFFLTWNESFLWLGSK